MPPSPPGQGPRPTLIAFPLRGEWACLRPPGHHPLALDFMAVGGPRRRTASAGRACFVLAPAAVAERLLSLWFLGKGVRVPA